MLLFTTPIFFEAADSGRGGANIVTLSEPIDAVLVTGVANTTKYGQGFDGSTDADGRVSMQFTSTGNDMLLTLTGFDVDHDAEVEVLLNGNSIGFLTEGVDNGTADYSFTISAGDIPAGDHVITFVQTGQTTHLWGVTDVMVEEQPAEALVLDTLNQGAFGNGFSTIEGTAADPDGRVAFTFDGTGNAMQLTYKGYDIDGDQEVRIFLNGQPIGYVEAGINDDFSDHTLNFSAGDLQSTNTLEFVMQAAPNFKWGVTDLMLTENTDGTPPVALTVGATDPTAYGMKWSEAAEDDTDGVVEFSFDSTGNDMQLTFDAHDIDWVGEVQVRLNGVILSDLNVSGNNATGSYTIDMSAADVGISGESNILTFQQMTNPTFKWGIKNVTVSDNPEEPIEYNALTVGLIESKNFGNKWAGKTDEDGKVYFTFDASTVDDHHTLTFRAYDNDELGELKVYLNGSLVKTVEAGLNEGFSNHEVTLFKGLMEVGSNEIMIEQAINPNWKWGITDLLVEEPSAPEPDVPTELTIGVVNTTKFGNKFDGATDDDGIVSFSFTATGEDMRLSFSGHDIDTGDEVGVYVNDVFFANLDAGVNNGNASYDIAFPAATFGPGENVISFKQEQNVTWKWGITNIVLQEDVPEVIPTLLLDTTDPGFYGQGYNGSSDPDGTFDMEFEGTAEDIKLTFTGYDIDDNTEVSVYLNGVKLTDLAQGVDNGTSAYSLIISAEDMVDGETQTLTFATNRPPQWKWGISDVRIELAAEEAAVPITLGEVEIGSWGNKFEGNTDSDGEQDFTFTASGAKDLKLTFQGHDIDGDQEVQVFLNGESVGYVSNGVNNGYSNHEMQIDFSDVADGENTLTFKMMAGVQWKWGIKDLLVEEVTPDAAIAIEPRANTFDFYGNGFTHMGDAKTDEDGRVDFEFIGEEGVGRHLRLMGYDIDGDWEVEVYLNGTSIGTLDAGYDLDYSFHQLNLDGALIVNGVNTVSFNQTGLSTYKWGVGNVQISDEKDTYVPLDPAYANQKWYMDFMGGMEEVWADYTGEGVKVGIVDDGVDSDHNDLNDNYDASLEAKYFDPAANEGAGGFVNYDAAANGSADHGTPVAGIIAAENDGFGTVGLAFNASIAGIDIFDGDLSVANSDLSDYYAALEYLEGFDVVNHSWGSTPGFDSLGKDFSNNTIAELEDAAEVGRGGLGTVHVKSAGNDTANSNGDLIDASRYTVTVAAADEWGDAAYYSNHGSNLLISAPSADDDVTGSGIQTTADGDSYTGDGAVDGFGGTSAAAPIISGVVALMMEANPGLGWRDVQEILAQSARHTDLPDGFQSGLFNSLGQEYDWGFNKAHNWNGGSMHYSLDFGFGVVHAHDAVRMAEAWSMFGPAQTSSNEYQKFTIDKSVEVAGDSDGVLNFFQDADAHIESVNVTLDIDDVSGVTVYLRSPDGTKYELFTDTDGDAAAADPEASFDGSLSWTFGAAGFRGEDLRGIWSIDIENADGTAANVTGSIDFYGKTWSGDDIYTYTDEMFAEFKIDGVPMRMYEDVERTLLTDSDGGTDWLNMAAMTGNLIVVLDDATDFVDGFGFSDGVQFLSITQGSDIDGVVTGDGDDAVAGNHGNNTINTGRGDDMVQGHDGDDMLTGGLGDDLFIFEISHDDDVITDFRANGEEDLIVFSNFSSSFDFSDLSLGTDGSGFRTIANGESGDLITLDGYTGSLTSDMFMFDDSGLVSTI